MNSKLTLYDALLGASVPADRARAVVEALEHEMYTVLATKTDLAAQAQLLNERLERLRAEIARDLAREVGGLRLELHARDASLREDMQGMGASLREEMGRGFDALRASVASIREAMGVGFDSLRESDDSIREEMGRGFDALRASDASIREAMGAGFDSLRASDASIREAMRAGFADVHIEMARLAHTLTLRMGAGLAATAGLLAAAQQLLR